MEDRMIEVKDMSFGYGKDRILTDVNFIVKKQEYVGIIGANGAGKSTLMKLILGQLTPDAGEVNVYTKAIGYVPQVGFHTVSNFPANVEEIVLTGLHKEIGMFHFPKKVHKQKVTDVLTLVGMADYRKRMLSELSGGQQQRVLIARALIGEPELMVLDEPFTGIDKEAGEMLYTLLDKLNKEYGMTIVMVTHNMEQVARYTNRFYHVSNGGVHLDKSSILCDEVLKEKMIISKPKRYGNRNSSGRKTYTAKQVDLPEKEEPYDASYKGKKQNGTKPEAADTRKEDSSC
ncbi:MAG: metal ABC transporter ATP-binding protein [Lachnospiraceae bacterium]